MAGGASSPGRSVVSRVAALLASFDAEHRQLSLSAVAERAGLPLSTAHRLVGDLVEHGVLARSGEQYEVGRRLWTLGLLAPVQTGLRDVAAPFLQDIYATTLATVHLAVREGAEVLYVDRLAGNRSVPVVSTVGSRLPLHTTGVGKVLLAWAPEPVQEAVLSAPLARPTPYSLTQPGRLREQLRRVREQGHAVTVEEMSLGACSVAVPVRRPRTTAAEDATTGPVVAALGLVVPSLGRERAGMVAALTVGSRGISRGLAALQS